MKSLEESILTAYLDGELPPEPRQVVETALQTNPRVAERLAELARVRDLVASLPRSGSPANLADRVLAGIALERASRIRRARRLLVASCGLAAAAAILLAAAWIGPVGHPRQGVPEVAMNVPVRPHLLPMPPRSPAPIVAELPSPTLEPVTNALPADLVAKERQAHANSVAVRELLGVGEVREIVVEVDALGTDTLDKVEDAIQHSNRRNPKHARLHLYQEVVVDPHHAGKVAAYVLVMDDVERQQFDRNLEANLPRAAHPDIAAESVLVAKLPEMGEIEMRGGLPKGTLMPPPDHLVPHDAFRDAPPTRPEDKVAEKVGTDPPAGRIRPGGPKPATPVQRPTSVYIVWVTTRDGPHPQPN